MNKEIRIMQKNKGIFSHKPNKNKYSDEENLEHKKREVNWLMSYTNSRNELTKKAAERNLLPDYASHDLAFWNSVYQEGQKIAEDEVAYWKCEAEHNEYELEGLRKIISEKDDVIYKMKKDIIEQTNQSYIQKDVLMMILDGWDKLPGINPIEFDTGND